MPFATETIYVAAAAIGGLILVIQIVMSLFGADHDVHTDFDADASHGGEVGGIVTLRTIVAFVTFFGLGGLAAIEAGHPGLPALVTALVSGSVAFAVAAAILLQFNRLRSSGTVVIKNAVGSQATVYLTVPAGRTGTGAVTVAIQGRTMQFKALTGGAQIVTGKLCKVVGVLGNDTLEVESL